MAPMRWIVTGPKLFWTVNQVVPSGELDEPTGAPVPPEPETAAGEACATCAPPPEPPPLEPDVPPMLSISGSV